MGIKQYARPEIKPYSRFYYSAPFEPLDKVYNNSERTSFLLLNTKYFDAESVRYLAKDITPDNKNPDYAPQSLGFMAYNYYSGVVPRRVFIAYNLAYLGLSQDTASNRMTNYRYIAGIDIEAMLKMARAAKLDHALEERLISIIERDAYLINNIGIRLNIEAEPIKDAEKSKYLGAFGHLFNETAKKPLNETPETYFPAGEKTGFKRDLSGQFGYNLKEYLTAVLHTSSKKYDKEESTFYRRIYSNEQRLKDNEYAIVF